MGFVLEVEYGGRKGYVLVGRFGCPVVLRCCLLDA